MEVLSFFHHRIKFNGYDVLLREIEINGD
jgi:hypothetical protein